MDCGSIGDMIQIMKGQQQLNKLLVPEGVISRIISKVQLSLFKFASGYERNFASPRDEEIDTQGCETGQYPHRLLRLSQNH